MNIEDRRTATVTDDEAFLRDGHDIDCVAVIQRAQIGSLLKSMYNQGLIFGSAHYKVKVGRDCNTSDSVVVTRQNSLQIEFASSLWTTILIKRQCEKNVLQAYLNVVRLNLELDNRFVVLDNKLLFNTAEKLYSHTITVVSYVHLVRNAIIYRTMESKNLAAGDKCLTI